jgi:hypothetical protein
MRALDTLELHIVGAELVEETQMRPLSDIIIIHRPEHGTKGIGIDDVPLPARIAGVINDGLEPIDIDHALEKTRSIAQCERADRLPVKRARFQRFGIRNIGPGDPLSSNLVQAQYRKGVVVPTLEDTGDLLRVGVPTGLLFCQI